MHGPPDFAFVIDNCRGVNNDAVSKAGIRADHCARCNHHIAAETGGGRYLAAGVNGVYQIESMRDNFLEVSASRRVIAYGDDYALYLLSFEFRQEINLTQYRQTPNGLASELRIGIQEPDRLVYAGRSENIQNNSTVTAGAD